ncbi:MAG TPA: DNA primase, partial [Bacillota bacterium]
MPDFLTKPGKYGKQFLARAGEIMELDRNRELYKEIKEKNDIVAVISEYVTLKRSGRSLVGLCPFHSEKTPSFNVNPAKQFYYCFGCSSGGDVFSFIMKMENLEFIDAAHLLADRAGILWPEERQITEVDRRREYFYRINQLAAAFFNQCLEKTTIGERGRLYLEERGLTSETRHRFLLGYAPRGWHSLTEILRKKQVPLEQAAELGLVGFGASGYYDRFRDRVIFPISDPKGRIIGFGGRIIATNVPPSGFEEPVHTLMQDSGSASLNTDPGQETVEAERTAAERPLPKYLNSPDSPLFRKGSFLYGLSLAKDYIRKKNQAIIMEGYLDVIQAHQAGIREAVASLGTALTHEQARLIKRYTDEVVLAYDADAAGQHATVRGMELLEEAGLRVRILALPPGDDPDSFIKSEGADAFNHLVASAKNLTDFKISLALREYNLTTPEGKSQAVQSILPVLGGIENNITREEYIRQLAREIGVSETAIFEELRKWLQGHRKKSPDLDRNDNRSYTKESNEQNGVFWGNIEGAEASPLKQAIFEAEKELLRSALQEYDKFERIKVELIAEEFTFKVWRDLFT